MKKLTQLLETGIDFIPLYYYLQHKCFFSFFQEFSLLILICAADVGSFQHNEHSLFIYITPLYTL